MKNNIVKTVIIIITMTLMACQTLGNWQPTVDPYNDQNAHRINQDLQECKQLAYQSSGGTGKETAVGAGVGALIGAAGGAVVGAFTGNPGTGAAIGAAAGGFGGGAKQGFGSENNYKIAFRNCMMGRGHHVLG